MDAHQYIEQLRHDSRRLADAAEGNLDSRVPGCPEWDVADLVWHVGKVDGFWSAMASGGQPDQYQHPDRPGPETLVAWYAGVAGGLADTLSSLAPTATCWTWSDQKDVAFVLRRMAHETAMHAWDALEAAGAPEPIDAALAVDGIDEYLEHHVPRRPGFADGPAVTVHLHATDADGEWLVAIGGGAYSVEHSHAKGDVAVRATASDLLLMLWGRVDPQTAADDRFTVFGDAAALASVRGDND
ncbi:MAG: maleylpyruvate isomerase family mycothiol-dependent enzyme [Acidimicrobiales bacterium]